MAVLLEKTYRRLLVGLSSFVVSADRAAAGRLCTCRSTLRLSVARPWCCRSPRIAPRRETFPLASGYPASGAPAVRRRSAGGARSAVAGPRARSEEHTSELQS